MSKRAKRLLNVTVTTLALFGTALNGVACAERWEPTDEWRWEIALHESGHVGAGRQSRVTEINKVTMTDRDGLTFFNVWAETIIEDSWLRCVLFAGGGETVDLFLNATPQGVGLDNDSIDETSGILMDEQDHGENIAPPWAPNDRRQWASAKDIEQACRDQADDAVMHHADDILTIAHALYETHYLSGKEIIKLIGEPKPKY